MKIRSFALTCVIALALASTAAWADQIILRDGKEYSGTFVRGDASVVEFRILGRSESFKTADVAQIVFKGPELASQPRSLTGNAPAQYAPPAAAGPVTQNPAPERESRSIQSNRQSSAPDNSARSTTFPSGTQIAIRTTETIDTDRNRVGDTFVATLEDPLMADNRVVAPRGTEVTGRIAYAKESGRVTGQSELILELTGMKLNGKTYAIRSSDYTEVGSSRGRRTATTAGGGAALGAIIGAIAGGGKGAAIGAGAGAAAGTGVAVMSRGQTLKVPAETILEFKLQSPLTVGVP